MTVTVNRRRLWVGVLCAAAVSFASCSDDGDEGDTAQEQGSQALMDELVEELRCSAADAGDYAIVASEAMRGVDCWTDVGQFRVHVYASEDDRRGASENEQLDLYTGEEAEKLDIGARPVPDVSAVVGDRWVVVAETHQAAQDAQRRVGGTVEASVVTPVSYPFPTEIPEDAERRSGG
jgi:hypothetical protein